MRPENQRCIEPSLCTVFLNQEAEMAIPKKAAISLRKLIPILLADFLDGSVQTQIALLDPDGALADALHLLDGVAQEQHRDVAGLDEVLDAGLALLLEEHITDGERLVHNQDVRRRQGGDGERDARDHAARIKEKVSTKAQMEAGCRKLRESTSYMLCLLEARANYCRKRCDTHFREELKRTCDYIGVEME